jgi:hypothetical protein
VTTPVDVEKLGFECGSAPAVISCEGLLAFSLFFFFHSLRSQPEPAGVISFSETAPAVSGSGPWPPVRIARVRISVFAIAIAEARSGSSVPQTVPRLSAVDVGRWRRPEFSPVLAFVAAPVRARGSRSVDSAPLCTALFECSRGSALGLPRTDAFD